MPFEAAQLFSNTKVELVNGTRGSTAKIQKVVVFILILLEHPGKKVNCYNPKETCIMVGIHFKFKKKETREHLLLNVNRKSKFVVTTSQEVARIDYGKHISDMFRRFIESNHWGEDFGLEKVCPEERIK